MGNVADKIADDSSVNSPMDSRLLGSTPPSRNQSPSLEWFDASEESIHLPANGSVMLKVEVVKTGGGGGVFRASESEIYLTPSSRSPTARFLSSRGSSRRSLSSTPRRLLLRPTVIPLPPPPKTQEEEEKEEGEKKEEQKEHQKEDEEGMKGEEKSDDEKEKEEVLVETSTILLQPPSNSSSPCPRTTPDVLSDIPSDILFTTDSSRAIPLPPPPSPSTSSAFNSVTLIFEEEEEKDALLVPPPNSPTSTISIVTVIESEEEYTLLGPPPTSEDEEEEGTSEATPTSNLTTDADREMRRQKKRERKKARQLNKEQQLKRQRLQRAEAIKNREDKLEREKSQQVVESVEKGGVEEEEEAAVVKETDEKEKDELPSKSEEVKEEEVTLTESTEVHQKETTTSSSTSTSSLSLPTGNSVTFSSTTAPISSKKDTEPDKKVYFMSGGRPMVFVPPDKRAEGDHQVTVEDVEQKQEEEVEEVDGEAGVEEYYGDAEPADSYFDFPEHPPVVMPFREAPIVHHLPTHSHPLPPQQMRHQPIVMGPPPQILPFNGPPQLLVGPINPYATPPPPFVPVLQPPPPPPPQQFNQGPPMVPVPMQRIPMQRMPVMINRPIMLPPGAHPGRMVPGPPHLPPGIPVPFVHYPARAPPGLARAPRFPLAISAPPEIPKTDNKKGGGGDTKKKTEAEKSKKVQKYVEKFKKERSNSVEEEEEQPKEPENPEVVEQDQDSKEVNIEELILAPQQEVEEVSSARCLYRRSSSIEMNGELISQGVETILDGDDSDDVPPLPVPSSSHPSTDPRPMSPSSEAQLEAINRVLEMPPPVVSDDIWSGFQSVMPPQPSKQAPVDDGFEREFQKMIEEDERLNQPNRMFGTEIPETLKEKTEEEKDKNPTLMSICEKLEPFFKSPQGIRYIRSTLDSPSLRDMFIEAYEGAIPREHWCILEKVCSFQPGYFHVFDVLIGDALEFTYKFILSHEFKPEKQHDTLYSLYQSLPPVDGVEKFFKRFEEHLIPDIVKFLSHRFISVRTFVAIAEVVKEKELTTSDLYYLATLVFGTRQFYTRFNARIKQIHIIETGGKRWIRQTLMDPLHSKTPSVPRMTTVADFLTKLRPHIDDILQMLPDSVVNEEEFFKAAKLVCGWSNGDDEEKIWKMICKDRSKLQEFLEAYRPFLRIELRMGAIYLRKLTYDDDYSDSETEEPALISSQSDINLISSIKSGKETKKKGVSYAAEIQLETPQSPPPITTRCTQTTNWNNMDQMWDLEKEVIRMLKRDNIPFAEFIKSENALEMYQFLVDVFKKENLQYFAFILEKTLLETRETAWKETNELREAAEEARLLLELAREEHRKEFGELKDRMETISRFETYEVQVSSNSRIESLKERISQLTKDREILLREEVKEERARLQRQLREMKEKHAEEKRSYMTEINRLREENARLLGGSHSILEKERRELTQRCENQMMKAKKMCENSSRLLLDSQREIEALRNHSILHSPESVTLEVEEEDPNVPTTSSAWNRSSIPRPMSPLPVDLTPDARRQLTIMKKYEKEIDSEQLLANARDLFDAYNTSKANHKERKTAEKQLKEFETALKYIENSIQENIQMIKCNVVEDLLVIPAVPMPFSETVLNKMWMNSSEKEEEEKKTMTTGGEISEEEDGCLICTEIVEESSEIMQCHTCYKEYHYHCISKWLKINSICPACSRALKDPADYPLLE